MNNIWVTAAKYVDGHRLALTFSDGLQGTVDLKDHLDKPVFRALQDIDQFKKFRIGSWTVEWDNGADFAPEFLHAIVENEIAIG